MNKMRIGSKLLLTYFLLIFSIFMVTSVSFHFISQRYLIRETNQQLKKEAQVISQLLGKTALSRVAVQEKLVNRKALAVTERLLTSKMMIWTRPNEIIYSDIKDATLEEVLEESKGVGRQFVAETLAITSKNGKTRGYVTLVARLDELQEINKLMRRSQLISLVISALIAVVLGVFFQRSLTRPIKRLTEHLKHYSVKGANREIRLNSQDEMGELADSFNALSRKLRQYDEDQKVFFQNASHELKTPLMAIQGNAEGILDGVVTGEDVNHSLQVIITESQRLKRIVEGVTYLAKLESVEESFAFTEESLVAVIREAVVSVEALAEQRGIEIRVVDAPVGTVRMDREKMKRAFINLFGNAIRYADSFIEVKISIDGQIRKRTWRIQIQDDGRGFTKGEEDKVFQRFYSGADGGSGIGLAITKAIIEGHKGKISAHNKKPRGAVFEIHLPQ